MLSEEIKFVFQAGEGMTAQSFKEQAEAQDDLSAVPDNMDNANTMRQIGKQAAVMGSSMMYIANYLKTIGVLNENQAKILNMIFQIATMAYAAMLLYQGIVAIKNALKTVELIKAGTLTTAHIAALDFMTIAIALAAALAAYSAIQFATGEWDFPINLDSESDRRQKIADAHGVMTSRA